MSDNFLQRFSFFALPRGLKFAIPVVVGILVLATAIALKGKPGQSPLVETATKVRVIDAPAVTVVPRIVGYGSVQPATTWNAVAEISGRIHWLHANLKKGAIVPKGATLLTIDPTTYKLALAQAAANARAAEAQLNELTVSQSNTAAALKIEARSLALSEKDFQRKKALLKKKAISQASLDQEERAVLARRLAVQNLRNQLNLIPSEREKLAAQLAVYTAQTADAELDLARTVIQAPFTGRIADVTVEKEQYANTGQVMIKLDGLSVAEVTAQVPINKLLSIMTQTVDTGGAPESAMANLPRLLGISPVVRLDSGELRVEWPARLARISDTIDPQTRTVGVIVAVDDPYGKIQPGTRPPLAKNMFVEVELRGPSRPDTIIVPRTAVRDGSVFVVTKENRLQRRAISVLFQQSNFVAVQGGVSTGETIVISDLVPAIDGMLLNPQSDAAARKALIDEAEGRSAVR